jgi:hypothetical protein
MKDIKNQQVWKIFGMFILLLVHSACSELELPETHFCERIDTRYTVPISLSNNNLQIKGSTLADFKDLVNSINAHREIGDGTDYTLKAKLYIDKQCQSTRLDSLMTALRMGSIYTCYFKVNSPDDSCWIMYKLSAINPSLDSLFESQLMEPSVRDSLHRTVIRLFKDDTLIINDLKTSLASFQQKLFRQILTQRKYSIVVLPQKQDTFGELVKFYDIYLSTVKNIRELYSVQKFGIHYSQLSEEQSAQIQRLFQRRCTIKFSTIANL